MIVCASRSEVKQTETAKTGGHFVPFDGGSKP